MPTWPQRIPLASLALVAFRQFLLLASPPSIPLSAYVYAVLGVPPTQTGTIVPVLLHIYARAFDSDCGYGSTGVTVNATVYAAPQTFRPDDRSSVWQNRPVEKADRYGAVVPQASLLPSCPDAADLRDGEYIRMERQLHYRTLYEPYHSHYGAKEKSAVHNNRQETLQSRGLLGTSSGCTCDHARWQQS